MYNYEQYSIIYPQYFKSGDSLVNLNFIKISSNKNTPTNIAEISGAEGCLYVDSDGYLLINGVVLHIAQGTPIYISYDEQGNRFVLTFDYDMSAPYTCYFENDNYVNLYLNSTNLSTLNLVLQNFVPAIEEINNRITNIVTQNNLQE